MARVHSSYFKECPSSLIFDKKVLVKSWVIANVVHKDPGAMTSTMGGGGGLQPHIIILWCVVVVCSCIGGFVLGFFVLFLLKFE